MLWKEHKTRGGLDIRCKTWFKPLQKKGTVPFQSITAPSHFVLMVISTDGNFFSRSPWMSLFSASQWWECVSEIQKYIYEMFWFTQLYDRQAASMSQRYGFIWLYRWWAPLCWAESVGRCRSKAGKDAPSSSQRAANGLGWTKHCTCRWCCTPR